MQRIVFLIGLALIGVAWAAEAQAQTLQYPPYGAWRGRAVVRDGLFRVQRYHWGNGITPTGGAVLTTALIQAPGIINAVGGLVNPASGNNGGGSDNPFSSSESAALFKTDETLKTKEHDDRMTQIINAYNVTAAALTKLGIETKPKDAHKPSTPTTSGGAAAGGSFGSGDFGSQN